LIEDANNGYTILHTKLDITGRILFFSFLLLFIYDECKLVA